MKLFILCVSLCCSIFRSDAQWKHPFFSRLEKNTMTVSMSSNAASLYDLTSPVKYDNIWLIRPVVLPATYSFPGNVALAGGGVSYQLLKTDSSGTYKSILTIAAPLYFGASLGSAQSLVKGIGASVGFLNNLLFFGGVYDGKQISATVSIGINLN